MQEKNFAEEYNASYKKYDLIVKAFQLGRDRAHRLKALQLANLKKGDTVLDICCGTGLSLGPIYSLIGPEGKIIAIDANEKMLNIAKQRATKNNWKNIDFVSADINQLELGAEKADLALFALCWYDREICTRWVQRISQFVKADTGKLCFLDYKFPENWVRHIATPVLSVLLRVLGEAYTLEDLKWNPKAEIGVLLENPLFETFYLDSMFALCGKPKK